jgi:hypothetical protein
VLAFLLELKVPAEAESKGKIKTELICRHGIPTLKCIVQLAKEYRSMLASRLRGARGRPLKHTEPFEPTSRPCAKRTNLTKATLPKTALATSGSEE